MNTDTESGRTLDFERPSDPRAHRVAGAKAVPSRRGADAFDAIVWRLRSNEDNPTEGFAVGVMGCHRRCGATTVAANVAIRYADHGLGPVLLVECNPVAPRLAKSFRLGRVAGLTEAVTGSADLSECIHATRVDGLDVMPLGAQKSLGGGAGIAGQFASLLSEVRSEYSVVMLDLPPADKSLGALLPIAQQADAVLLVLRSEATRRRAASNALQKLRQDGVSVIGSVVTRRKSFATRWLGASL
ncbi:Tyrosine-protein kinase CpsD [Posidoniimonas polymericola]|uniref:Tyrosine-protein kinase CpsD n=1 Tax=Posidoniimonas polymericola TaxID=2528002 RepID=A0A5C5XZB2_9BACT|nr:CpsD/CapB family tyrosine-protein kinase [Posidoniimonas polymericola]TWT67623.1 Tyrosine-protein kinase CpsD [Posidoniimonas polymericola]